MSSDPTPEKRLARHWSRVKGPLFVERCGPVAETPQVLIHGFTQTSRSWDPYIAELPSEEAVVRLDAPNHALSENVTSNLVESADLIASQCGRGNYIGYSMGGRIALHVALRHPEKVRTLVLISSTAGIEDAEERQRRIASDEELAVSLEVRGVEAFLDQWLSNPMFANMPRADSDYQDRCRNSVTGLASSLRHCGTGQQNPLWEDLAQLSMPVLLIVGEQDAKFVDIGQKMHSKISHSRLVVVARCGHSVHLEEPELSRQLIADFLNENKNIHG